MGRNTSLKVKGHDKQITICNTNQWYIILCKLLSQISIFNKVRYQTVSLKVQTIKNIINNSNNNHRWLRKRTVSCTMKGLTGSILYCEIQHCTAIGILGLYASVSTTQCRASWQITKYSLYKLLLKYL